MSLSVKRRTTFCHLNFFTCFYVLNAGLAHQKVAWVWEKINSRAEIRSWHTLYYNIAGDSFIIDTVMCSWIFFSFLVALFPHFQLLRMGTFFSFFGYMTLSGEADKSFPVFFIEILPLAVFALTPSSFLFSEKASEKINFILRKNLVSFQNGKKPDSYNDDSLLNFLFFSGHRFPEKVKVYHTLVMVPLLIIIFLSFQKYLFYKQSFFMLISLFAVFHVRS